MNDVAIRVENLSKLYRIGARQAQYKTLRDTFSETFAAPLKRLTSAFRGESTCVSSETIWALKDISFEIKRGDIVGIIGRNGAGKSTLLKILSRITEPTTGTATIRGRVGSLLEVGTGFHPELSGRENIFLNGAILGMSRWDIKNKFDEIVAFAEIEKFIDTPVKHYSSGMYTRLAFAVASSLDTDILLIDEVLSVGDYSFQNKSLGKMGNISKEGRTVILVSHNLRFVEMLTSKCIYINSGKIESFSNSSEVVKKYQKESAQQGNTIHLPEIYLKDNLSPIIQISPLVIKPKFTEVGENLTVTFDLVANKDIYNPLICNNIFQNCGIISGNYSAYKLNPLQLKKNKEVKIQITYPKIGLMPGEYQIVIFILKQLTSKIENAISNFSYETFNTISNVSTGGGHFFLNQKWEIIK